MYEEEIKKYYQENLASFTLKNYLYKMKEQISQNILEKIELLNNYNTNFRNMKLGITPSSDTEIAKVLADISKIENAIFNDEYYCQMLDNIITICQNRGRY